MAQHIRSANLVFNFHRFYSVGFFEFFFISGRTYEHYFGKWTNLAVLARNKDKVSVLLNNRCYNTEKEKKVEVKNCIFYSAKMKNN